MLGAILPMGALLTILIALQIADIWTTLRFLKAGRAHEANPLIAGLMSRIGVVPALVVAKAPLVGIFTWLALTYPHSLVVAVVLSLACAAYVGVVVHNRKYT